MDFRAQFPIFQNDPSLVYLDSAATAQKPQAVIDALVDFYTKHNANVHRGLYPLSETATEMYEQARRTVAKFINAEPEEIIFVGGTTDGLNAIAESLYKSELIAPNPKILVSELEHHANILPWQQLPNSSLHFIPIDENFQLDLRDQDNLDDSELKDMVDIRDQLLVEGRPNPDVVAVTQMSNVTGSIVDIVQIRELFPQSYLVVDAAQSAPHMQIDVKALDVDFLVFSGHKLYGPTGVGVIYGKHELLEKMEPFRVGGGMIREVNRDKATWAELPEKFEAGTPPIAEAIGLAAAIDFLQKIGWDEIRKHEQELADYAFEKMSQVPGLKLFTPTPVQSPIFSFTVEGIHPHDLAQILGEQNVCVRAGHHCCQILHREIFKVPASTRVSLGMYNSHQDIDKLIAGINLAREKLL